MDRLRKKHCEWFAKYLCVAAFVGMIVVASHVHAVKPKSKPKAPPTPDGFELFHRDWSKQVPDHALDGIGPMYNAVSCVACHHQGGAGGGGKNEHNVQLLTLTAMPVQAEEAVGQIDLKALRETPLHPGLATTSSVVLHRFSTDPSYYPMLRMFDARPQVEGIGSLLGLERIGITHEQIVQLPHTKPGYAHGLAYARSQRNTPALFGLGYIDAISSQTLEKIRRLLTQQFPEVSGRLAPNGGKFGWRGQSPSVHSFVVGACANEIGLQTPGIAQAANPVLLADPEKRKTIPDPNDTRSDMTPAEISAMVKFVAELQPPRFERPRTHELNVWKAGQASFSSARCDACHVHQIGDVVGIFSDLLLHDMGPKLSDPAALSSSTGLTTQYYGTGESLLVSDERKQEWRTPPLWGVRYSAPYLHDGSAETITDAIIAHGGEATTSRIRFVAMSEEQRQALVRYVESLGAITLPRQAYRAH